MHIILIGREPIRKFATDVIFVDVYLCDKNVQPNIGGQHKYNTNVQTIQNNIIWYDNNNNEF